MDTLTVLYDSTCPLCVRCARWLTTQEAYVRIEVLPALSQQAVLRYGHLRRGGKQELIVIDDQGGVYRDSDAWLMCLWALTEYRAWSTRLASPAMRPLARGMFEVLSANRRWISEKLFDQKDEHVREYISRAVKDARHCETGSCEA